GAARRRGRRGLDLRGIGDQREGRWRTDLPDQAAGTRLESPGLLAGGLRYNRGCVAPTLSDLLPYGPEVSSDLVLDRFLDYVSGRGLALYPAQEEAILALLDGRNVVLNTPTGSGKSLVATAMLFAALARHERAVCTFPIKALVNEKWMQLCREFGPEYIGLATGDASVNRDAPILCCTAEILGN